MNIYYSFYCRAYDWYNKTGKKSKDTLRISAITLLSAIPNFNLVSFIIFLSVLNKHTLLSKWGGLSMMIITIIINLFLISPLKSDFIREEYSNLNLKRKKSINFYFNLYLIISVLLFIGSLGYLAYYKNKYGNYDL